METETGLSLSDHGKNAGYPDPPTKLKRWMTRRDRALSSILRLSMASGWTKSPSGTASFVSEHGDGSSMNHIGAIAAQEDDHARCVFRFRPLREIWRVARAPLL
jgi:hypothetical protein